MKIQVAALVFACGLSPAFAEQFSINDAINQAVLTNPGVGEASANRRATESELRQTQSTLLPQVRLEARAGPEKFTQAITPAPTGSGQWLRGREASVVVRQILFDGFASINDIWRQSARVNAAAFRVQERTELIALDAAEAYIDVVRYMRLVGLAQQNVENHQTIFSNVNSRFSGGRSGEGDLQQALERVESAKAALAEFQKSLDDARAKYRKVVGIEDYNLRFPSALGGMPANKEDALAIAIRKNPTLLASQSDADAAKHAFRASAGAFAPTVSLEGRVSRGIDADTFVGRRDDVSGKVVMSWDIFRGGQDSWRRTELAERYNEQTMRNAKLQRDALESIDKAWSARTITATRVAALTRQLAADKKAIAAYKKEYELGQRSLIDLLNAENQYFNAAVSLTSSRGVIVFADYQLLAAMGSLLEYLRTAPPVDAAPLDTIPFGLFPTKIAPIILNLPPTGSAPLNVGPDRVPVNFDPGVLPNNTFGDRWQRWSAIPASVEEWLPGKATKMAGVALAHSDNGQPAMSFAAGETFDRSASAAPNWLKIGHLDVKPNP